MVSYILAHQVGFFIIGVIALVVASFTLVFAFVTWRKTSSLQHKITAFCAGKDGAALEDALLALTNDVRNLDSDIQELFTISNKIHALARRGLHKIAMIRFNPFKDLGGDQSFSLALLDGKNNGIILSSLHTREGTRIYSKSIRSGKAQKHKLTDEEYAVLDEAMAQKVIVAPKNSTP